MDSLGEAWVDIRANLSTLDADLREVGKVLERTLGQIGQHMASLGRKLTLFVTAPILALGAASVKTASDIQEMRNLLQITFGDAAQDVEDWANATAEQVGRASSELMKFAGDFAAFLKPLGVADEAIVPMSEALTQLTVDIASFRNLSEEDVFTKLFGGLAGQSEGVRRLGIDLGTAAIEAELLRMGFKGTAEEATQGMKAVARYNLIVAQTQDAQGDAERTSGGFSNSLRRLQATWTDIRKEIGEKLLPVAQRMLNMVIGLGRKFLELSDPMQRTIIIIGTIAAAIGPVLIVLGTFLSMMALIPGGIANVVKAFVFLGKGIVSAVLVAVKAFNVLISSIFSLPGLIGAAIALAIAAVLLFPETLKKVFSLEALRALLDVVHVAFHNFVVVPIARAIAAIKGFFKDLFNIDLTEAEEQVARLNRRIAELPPQSGFRKRLENDLLFWNRTLEDLRAESAEVGDAMSGGLEEIQPIELQERTRTFFGDLGDTFTTEAAAAKETISNAIGNMIDGVKSLIPDWLANLFGIDVESLLADLEQAGSVVTGTLDNLTETVVENADTMEVAFDDLGDTIRSSFEDNLTDALTQVKTFEEAVDSILKSILEQIIRLTITQPFANTIATFLGFPAAGAAGSIPGLAMGGVLRAGHAAIVGEKGPEVFVPDVSGKIVPNHEFNVGAMGPGGMGGLHLEQHVHFDVGLESVDARIAQAAPSLTKVTRDAIVSAFSRPGMA